MIDITSSDSSGIGTYNTQTHRAANILQVQLGALEYAPTMGIDLKYFLSEDLKFQNESFQAYLIQTLAEKSINVANLFETLESLYSTYNINLTPDENSGGMIAR
jgi:hypothetical protein